MKRCCWCFGEATQFWGDLLGWCEPCGAENIGSMVNLSPAPSYRTTEKERRYFRQLRAKKNAQKQAVKDCDTATES